MSTTHRIEVWPTSHKKRMNELDYEVLSQVAKSGVPLLPWSVFRPVVEINMRLTLQRLLANQNNDAAALIEDTVRMLRSYDCEAPFTIQRICELLLEQQQQKYMRFKALINAFQSLLQVTSTIPRGNTEQITQLEREYRKYAPSPPPIQEDEASVGGLSRTDTLDMV